MEVAMKLEKSVSIVVPCYCEEEGILPFYESLKAHISFLSNYEILFIDDGSSDNTLMKLKEIAQRDANVRFLSFSRNFGHQAALKAGLDYSVGDCVISLDADLQHPPRLIKDLYSKWQEGYEIVYTKRLDGSEVKLFKKVTSKIFYKIINKVSSIALEGGCADFRLMDRKVVDCLKQFKETDLFYRGLISWVGYKQYCLEYIPEARVHGESKYTLVKMIKFSLSGITAFSTRPLHLSTLMGGVLSFFCLLYAVYAILMKVVSNEVVPGWASIVVSILFIGGAQLILMGVIGEYLGKLFLQAKQRPAYIIREKSES